MTAGRNIRRVIQKPIAPNYNNLLGRGGVPEVIAVYIILALLAAIRVGLLWHHWPQPRAKRMLVSTAQLLVIVAAVFGFLHARNYDLLVLLCSLCAILLLSAIPIPAK